MALWDNIKQSLGIGVDVAGAQVPASAVSSSLAAQSEFLREAQSVIEKLVPLRNPRSFPEEMSLSVQVGERHCCLDLHQAFCVARVLSPERRQQYLETELGSVLGALLGDEKRDRGELSLLPVLRPWSALFQISSHGVHRPILPFLCESLATDCGSVMAYLQKDDLEARGWEESYAFRLGHCRLRSLADAAFVEAYDSSAPYPIWAIQSREGFQSSFVGLQGWLLGFTSRILGRPIAVLPYRDLLVVSGDADERAIERLLDIAAVACFDKGPRVSPALYTVDDAGELGPYELPKSHPLAARVKSRPTQLASNAYEIQARHLHESVGAMEPGVSVGSYVTIHDARLGAMSFSTWSRDSQTLLPLAEFVVFSEPHAEPFAVPFEAVAQHVGDCWRFEAGMNPPRMRTVNWPSDEALASLRAFGVASFGRE